MVQKSDSSSLNSEIDRLLNLNDYHEANDKNEKSDDKSFEK